LRWSCAYQLSRGLPGFRCWCARFGEDGFRLHALSECCGKCDGLLADFRNGDGFKKVAEASRAKVEEDVRSVTIDIDDRSMLGAMESGA
jgi:hypothetical protein